jgi:hypothetical protein
VADLGHGFGVEGIWGGMPFARRPNSLAVL